MGNAIRANIPDCRQTNAKFFPDYEYREFPKQIFDKDGPIFHDPTFLMTTPPMNSSAEPDKVMRKGPDGVRRPVVIGGAPVMVHDAEEEAEYIRDNPGTHSISVHVATQAPATQGRGGLSLVRQPSTELAAARAEIAELEALAARKAELLAQMEKPASAKRGPKPRTAAVAEPEAESGEGERQSLAEFAGTAED